MVSFNGVLEIKCIIIIIYYYWAAMHAEEDVTNL